MPGDKSLRVPLSKEDRAELERLLADVPAKSVKMFDWKSEPGRTFVKAIRKVQLKGVPMPWIAEALGVGRSALNGAVGYYERNSNTRGSIRQLRERRNATRRKLIEETERLRGRA